MDSKKVTFGKEEDNVEEVSFMLNIIYDIINDIFHYDYLLASVTAALWMRCLIILRLTELFGPTVVMV